MTDKALEEKFWAKFHVGQSVRPQPRPDLIVKITGSGETGWVGMDPNGVEGIYRYNVDWLLYSPTPSIQHVYVHVPTGYTIGQQVPYTTLNFDPTEVNGQHGKRYTTWRATISAYELVQPPEPEEDYEYDDEDDF